MQSQLDPLGPSKMTSNCFKFFQQLGTSQLLKLHSRIGSRSEGGNTLDRYELLTAVLQHLAEVGYRKYGCLYFQRILTAWILHFDWVDAQESHAILA